MEEKNEKLVDALMRYLTRHDDRKDIFDVKPEEIYKGRKKSCIVDLENENLTDQKLQQAILRVRDRRKNVHELYSKSKNKKNIAGKVYVVSFIFSKGEYGLVVWKIDGTVFPGERSFNFNNDADKSIIIETPLHENTFGINSDSSGVARIIMQELEAPDLIAMEKDLEIVSSDEVAGLEYGKRLLDLFKKKEDKYELKDEFEDMTGCYIPSSGGSVGLDEEIGVYSINRDKP